MFIKKQKKLIEKNNLIYVNDNNVSNNLYRYYYRWKSTDSFLNFFYKDLICINIKNKRVFFDGKILINKRINIITMESSHKYKKIYIKN